MSTEEKYHHVRPSWPKKFMKIAYEVAEMSTCARLQTGALLIKDKRIISMGYNGSVPGARHCWDIWHETWENGNSESENCSWDEFLQTTEFREGHHRWSTKHEIHGEQNAILYASKNGISTKDSEMYTVYSPCINCAKVMITAGITKVYYAENYHRDTSGLDFLQENGIICEQISI